MWMLLAHAYCSSCCVKQNTLFSTCHSTMAPARRRGSARKQVGLGRMDAAYDAMKLLGFPRDLVRKTVQNLLQVYGGDEGWPFIEDACYKVLIDTILEQGDTEKPKKEENSLEQAEENGNDHSPIASPSQPSMQIVAWTTKSDTPEEECKITAKLIKAEEECRTPVQSIKAAEECRTPVQSIKAEEECRTPVQSIKAEEECRTPVRSNKVEFTERHDSLPPSASRSMIPSCLTDSFQDKKLDVEIRSKVPQDRLPRQRRNCKPCYGWISSDEEEDVST